MRPIADVGLQLQLIHLEAAALMCRHTNNYHQVTFAGSHRQENHPTAAVEVEVDAAEDGTVHHTDHQRLGHALDSAK